MKITVQLGNSNEPTSSINLTISANDPTVGEVLVTLRQELSPWYLAVMERGIDGLQGDDGIDSVAGGIDSLPQKASLFLAQQSEDGLKKLDEHRHVSEYAITNGSVIWLMCSPRGLDK